MINWKLISTLLAKNYCNPPLGGRYNFEHLLSSWNAHFNFQPMHYFDPATMHGNLANFYDFFMTLAHQENKKDFEKVSDILELLYTITGGFKNEIVAEIFTRGGYTEELKLDFKSNNLSQCGIFHSEIIKHSSKYFEQKNYFHSVQEACKAYNNRVKKMAESDKNGIPLMQFSLSPKGTIKFNPNKTESEINEQNGIKSLSEGLISAFRNPTSHENATEWHINKLECIQILNLISFLFSKLDKATIEKK